jgi:hypothetical protein
MKKTMTALAVLVLAVSSYAGPGTGAFDILKVSAGIKSQGMGGAYTAACRDAEAMDMNPAGLAYIEKQEILFIHDIYLEEIFYDSLYYGQGLGEAGSFGVALRYLNQGTVVRTIEDDFGNYLGTEEEVSGMNYLVSIGYAIGIDRISYSEMTKNIKAGITLKLAGEQGGEYSSVGGAADIGFMYNMPLGGESFLTNRGEFVWSNIGLGLALRNMGASTSAGLTPFSAAIGAYTEMINIGTSGNGIKAALEADFGAAGITVKFGGEYRHRVENMNFSLRLGGDVNPGERLSAGFSAGAGFVIKADGVSYGIDYVFLPFAEFGAGHKAGFGVSF